MKKKRKWLEIDWYIISILMEIIYMFISINRLYFMYLYKLIFDYFLFFKKNLKTQNGTNYHNTIIFIFWTFKFYSNYLHKIIFNLTINCYSCSTLSNFHPSTLNNLETSMKFNIDSKVKIWSQNLLRKNIRE